MQGRVSAGMERAALVGLVTGSTRRLDAERSMEELDGLAEAAGARVVLRVLQERPKPDPATFLGSGKIATLAQAVSEADVDLVIFDNELSPAQLREIGRRLERKVIDRTQLILDIFARRAQTREGKLRWSWPSSMHSCRDWWAWGPNCRGLAAASGPAGG
ncbi:MAG: hypothetical protein R2712_10845 [Vicinamibacterales bacterium]